MPLGGVPFAEAYESRLKSPRTKWSLREVRGRRPNRTESQIHGSISLRATPK